MAPEPTATVSRAAIPLGLTSEDAAARRRALPARPAARTSRTYRDIIWSNTFTVFNLILGALFVLILALGSWRDGLFGGVIIANTAIGIAQEVRAKRTLERLALLVAPTAQVWRDGALLRLPPGRLVVDDVVHVVPGDQIVADGRLVAERGLAFDESLLTGESAEVHKAVGDEVRSGAFCLAGSGDYLVTAVGADSFAETLAAEARGTRGRLSPLQEDINRVLGATVYLMVPLAVVLVAVLVVRREPFFDGARRVVAALVPLVPEGLVLLTSLTFAVAAVRLGRLGALAQRLNAIEALAAVDVVCIDKTGTLTDNRLRVARLEPAEGHDLDELRHGLAVLAGSAGERNGTLQALAEAVTPIALSVTAEVPFTSQRKWSGVTTPDAGTIVLGAPDVLQHAGIAVDASLEQAIATATAGRHRVVMLARGTVPLIAEGPLPTLSAVGVAILSEGVRADAVDTVRFLQRQGTEIKVISGDNAQTVTAVAARCGIDVRGEPVDGWALPDDPSLLDETVNRATVFGRITPHQKRNLVQALERQGRFVAMIGDGVNDVLALKDARLAIAMGSGSQMAKGVADLVLLDSDFATVPRAIEEGRRILRNTHRVAKLFVSKTVYAALLLVTIGLAPIAFPFLPRHLSVTSSLTIGIPAFFLALAPSFGPVRTEGFMRSLLAFTVPIGGVAAAAIAAAYLLVRGPLDAGIVAGRTAAVIVATVLGLAIVVILERGAPSGRVRWWVWAMVAGFGALFSTGLSLAPLRAFFEVSVPSAGQWLVVAAVCAAAIGAMLAVRHIPALRRLDVT